MFLLEQKLIDFDDIDSGLLEEAKFLIAAALAISERVEHPRLVHMCRIPGSGKTTYAKKWIEENSSFSMVQFDAVMEQLSGYRRDREQHGIVEAFKRWELQARAIGYHLLQSLVENERNVFFDHSATSKQHIQLVESLKKRGYLVEMIYLECLPAVALERVKKREKIIQRHTPEHLIFERYKLLEEILPTYKKSVDKFVQVAPAV